jgi:hypothetical protein
LAGGRITARRAMRRGIRCWARFSGRRRGRTTARFRWVRRMRRWGRFLITRRRRRSGQVRGLTREGRKQDRWSASVESQVSKARPGAPRAPRDCWPITHLSRDKTAAKVGHPRLWFPTLSRKQAELGWGTGVAIASEWRLPPVEWRLCCRGRRRRRRLLVCRPG